MPDTVEIDGAFPVGIANPVVSPTPGVKYIPVQIMNDAVAVKNLFNNNQTDPIIVQQKFAFSVYHYPQRWEYSVSKPFDAITGDDEAAHQIVDALNELNEQGAAFFELVCVVGAGPGKLRGIFKKPLNPE